MGPLRQSGAVLTRAFGLMTAMALTTEACCELAHVSILETQTRPYVNGKPALAVGGQTQLFAEARGNAPCVLYDSVHDPQSFHWSSSDTAVVAISQSGAATARALGEAMITAETKGVVGRFTLTVVP